MRMRSARRSTLQAGRPCAPQPELRGAGRGGVFAVAAVIEADLFGLLLDGEFVHSNPPKGQMCRGRCPIGPGVLRLSRCFLVLFHDNALLIRVKMLFVEVLSSLGAKLEMPIFQQFASARSSLFPVSEVAATIFCRHGHAARYRDGRTVLHRTRQFARAHFDRRVLWFKTIHTYT